MVRYVPLCKITQLQKVKNEPEIVSPTIIDIGLFPVVDCILARDKRLAERGGKWFGDFETPAVLSKTGKLKKKLGLDVDHFQYGRKASEAKDYNEDTNFGKLKRIPFKPLQEFLKNTAQPMRQRALTQNLGLLVGLIHQCLVLFCKKK
jgi:hypothetical protein